MKTVTQRLAVGVLAAWLVLLSAAVYPQLAAHAAQHAHHNAATHATSLCSWARLPTGQPGGPSHVITIILAWRLDGFAIKISTDLRDHDSSSHRETCSIREQASIDRRQAVAHRSDNAESSETRSRAFPPVFFVLVGRAIRSAWRSISSRAGKPSASPFRVPLVDFAGGPPYS